MPHGSQDQESFQHTYVYVSACLSQCVLLDIVRVMAPSARIRRRSAHRGVHRATRTRTPMLMHIYLSLSLSVCLAASLLAPCASLPPRPGEFSTYIRIGFCVFLSMCASRHHTCHGSFTQNTQQHQWSSGRIHRCHRCGPGSIPG